MKVRSLEVDFSDIGPHWSENIEFAQTLNATSTVPAYVEPYLAKVLAKARRALPSESGVLNQQVSIFIRQEMEHCKQHVAFNEMLIRAYPQIIPLLGRYGADYERFLRTRSLQFNVAYSEGFESAIGLMTPSSAQWMEASWAQSDPRVEALWKWHYAEEYEHREVMYDVYHALFGRGVRAYFYRIYGFFYALLHIRAHISRTRKAMAAADQARMEQGTPPKPLKLARKRGLAPTLEALRKLLEIVSPAYDPSKRQAPDGVEAILAQTNITAPIAGSELRGQ